MYFNSRPREGGDPRNRGIPYPDQISIRAPARGATCAVSCPVGASYFNSRPREGGDWDLLERIHRTGQFQFAPPRGGRPPVPPIISPPAYFNSRPREGGDILQGCQGRIRHYFNSRPREGGDIHDRTAVADLTISIRAPARGGDWDLLERIHRTGQFQFAPPRGGRQHIGTLDAGDIGISIRAPARGATAIEEVEIARLDFNSRPREGGDLHLSNARRNVTDFNSRPREGGDLQVRSLGV